MADRAGRRRLTALRRPGRLLIAVVLGLLLAAIFGRSAAIFYTDALWYRALQYGDVFWTRTLTIVAVRAITGAIGAAIILLNVWYVLRQLGPVHLRRRYGNIEIAEQIPRRYLITAAILIAVLAGWWLSSLQFGGNAAIALLAWLRADAWGATDPLFGRDLSFYVFALPMYFRLLDYLFIVLVWSLLLVGAGYALVGAVRLRGTSWEIDDRPRVHFAILVAAMLAIFGVRYLLGRYEFLLEGTGFGGVIGYTDVHARLPARLLVGVLSFVTAGALWYGAARRTWTPPAVALALLILAGLGMGVVYPAFVQRIRVEPNQLARESQFIQWNIDFTRRAYGLQDMQRRSFTYRRATPETWAQQMPALEHLPLWDLPQLQTVFIELQGRRNYYTFPDLDYDRYKTDRGPRQVAIGVREFTDEGLPPASRTWQTLHLNPAFTRGIGAVVAPAAERFASNPVFWLRDLQPVQRHEAAPLSLDIREPSVFFGETMADYVIVGHRGGFASMMDDSATTLPVPHVETGVPLSSFLRVAAFALRFGEQNLLFASELGDSSRVLFRRAVVERVSELAPFLLWDGDALPVIAGGRIVWVVDGYTATSNFPLARPDTIEQFAFRYLRGGVKATVDAVTGAVNMYAVGTADPILNTYRRIFPGLIQDQSRMPAFLREHLRYPILLFRTQTDMLEEYHLERPETFFAGQDVWEVPVDPAVAASSDRQPPFMMATLPGADRLELLLVSPFIAQERQNLTGLLIARSDSAHYGELVLLEMPRDEQIRGPSQIASIIDADPVISQQLALWTSRGRTVQRGQLRMVPTDSSILYIQPLFLSATEQGIPQLQQVIVTDGTAVAMAEHLPRAIDALLGGAVVVTAPVFDEAPQDAAGTEWRVRALDLMQEAEARLRAGDFAGFGAAWSRLRALLEQQTPR